MGLCSRQGMSSEQPVQTGLGALQALGDGQLRFGIICASLGRCNAA